MTSLIKIQDFSLDIDTFDGTLHVLKNISLEIERGDTFGIVGESGSGKSVLVRTMLGIGPSNARHVDGKMTFDGIDLTALTEKGWRKLRGIRISMIFQDPMTYLNPLITVGTQIIDVIAAHRRAAGNPVGTKTERLEFAADLLAQVDIPDPARVLDQFAFQLSGGMRQRVLISMALAGHPDVLIADEPTTALDVTVQAQVLDLINDLAQRLNLTVIFISHDIGAVATVAKKCAVMKHGEIVEQGTTREILTAPKHPYTVELLDAVPELGTGTGEVPQTAPTENPILTVSNLRKRFNLAGGGTLDAVKNVSFSVEKGEILGVVGESGSGKSTLARMILRLIEPTSGSVRFEDREITQLSPAEMLVARRDMQMVFQNPHSALNGRHTIGDAITEPLRLNRKMSRLERERRLDELLDIVHLPRIMKYRYPHELSGGQKQRVCIARAISLNPKLLVLDEPTSALDVSVQAKVLDFLKQLRQEMNLTYLFISHDLAVVRELCDRCLVMRRGEVVEQGLTGAVFFTPNHEYTRALIASGQKTSKDAALAMV
ncbi:dipeptide ABC transporter ATP-binding protein [Antarctobacter sp.]|uniref:dipeptide ABC transporter ATP-binding protein n=1 Tax=Antarctobacter sp. TaxID=1872577 RepID=UPI003A92DE55